MTQPNQAQDLLEFTVDPVAFNFMQKGSEQAFGKEISELSFDEAARLVGGMIISATQTPDGKVTSEGSTVVDAELDGQEMVKKRWQVMDARLLEK